MTARKLVRAIIRVRGALSVDDTLAATAHDLLAEGEGVVGSLVVGFVRPHLDRFNGRSFPLTALRLGDIELRDVSVSVNDGLLITAAFGQQSA